MRRMSDDFDVRKFPDLMEGVKMRQRSKSLDITESVDESQNDQAPKMIRFLRRLSSGAITPSDTKFRGLVSSQQPPLTESSKEEEEEQEMDDQ